MEYEKKLRVFIYLAFLTVFVAGAGAGWRYYQENKNTLFSDQDKNKFIEISDKTPEKTSEFHPPIGQAETRVTKKPFGMKVSPTSSPIQPEKFSGYHTGVDFETFPAEDDLEIPIFAICNGILILKKQASGYGGVAVESCQLENKGITVIYGHLNLESIFVGDGGVLYKGKQLGILGKGYSDETDGERKHLHLGIHKGKDINLLGYTQNQNELENWLDITQYILKK